MVMLMLLQFTVDQRKARPAPGHPPYLSDKATLGGRKRSGESGGGEGDDGDEFIAEDEAPDPGHIRDNQTTNLPKGINRLSREYTSKLELQTIHRF